MTPRSSGAGGGRKVAALGRHSHPGASSAGTTRPTAAKRAAPSKRERERDTEICRDESGGLEGAQSIKALKEVKENIRKQPQSTKSSYTS